MNAMLLVRCPYWAINANFLTSSLCGVEDKLETFLENVLLDFEVAGLYCWIEYRMYRWSEFS